MKKHQKVNIQYAKTDSEVTDRTIIPISIPTTVVTSIDVTELDEEQANAVESEYKRYSEYRERHMQQLFNFTDWLEHTNSSVDAETLKFRSFKPEKITITD